MKVVINACYGGFGLSDSAFEKFLDRKGIAWEKCINKYNEADHYNKGHMGEHDYFLFAHYMIKDRSDPDLVAVVEEMDELANSKYSKLKVVEIPDGTEWTVHEYDGMEWIAEAHRTWN